MRGRESSRPFCFYPLSKFPEQRGSVWRPYETGPVPGCSLITLGDCASMSNAGTFLEPWLRAALPWLYLSTWWWTAVGFAGNILFGSRFILQWLQSEKEKKLVVPGYFWHLSFWGSVLNLFYAFHLDSAPLILGVAALPFIYGRNLVLLRRTVTVEVKTSGAATIEVRPSGATA